MLRPSPRALERRTLAAAFALTWPVEIALAERKYGMLGGGFGQSRALDGAGQVVGYLLVTALAQLVALSALYLLIRAVARDPARREERLFAFLFVAVGLSWLVLAAKLELLSYFSDAVSFQLLRNLGGGSLLDAALFGLSEGALYLAAVAGAAAAFLLVRWALRRRAHGRPAVPAPPAITGRGWIALALVTAAAVLAADRVRNVRLAAHRVTAYALLSDALAVATDLDRDGYGWAGAEVDRHPFDATRHPFALDVPGDGIDGNGLAGDFTLPPAPPAFRAPPLPARPRHLVLVVLESTRGDVLGKRVGGRAVAPNLEALAASGSVAREAYSHVGFTTASLKSLFTGTLAPPGPAPSLFRDLKRAGYRIGVFSGQPEAFGDIDAAVGERATADVFVDAATLKDERAGAFAAQGSLLVDEGKLLREFDRGFGDAAGWRRPTFAYLNFQSPHFPYHHEGMANLLEPHPLPRGEIAPGNRARLERTYWNAVAHADARLGELVARLRRLGVWDDTLLVVTADHGESLFDDGFLGHGHLINRQQTHVPLVLSQSGVRLPGAYGLDDYRALILSLLAGRPAPPPDGPVFQYIGTLDRPAQIGTVETGGRRTVYDFDTGDVRFDDAPPRLYAALPPAARARADALIRLWELERWRAARR